MKLYSVELKLCATAYIKAASEEEAMQKAIALQGSCLPGDIPISELQYSDPNLPEVSFSPAMTIHEPWGENVEYVHDYHAPARRSA